MCSKWKDANVTRSPCCFREVPARKKKKRRRKCWSRGLCRTTCLFRCWSTMTFCLYLGTLSPDLTRGVSPEELLLCIYQLLAVGSLLYLAQSLRITIYILIDFPSKEPGSHFIISIFIACHCTQEFITCLIAMLFLLERFLSWNCLMDPMLH